MKNTSLLPKTVTDFSSQAYWDTFFKLRKDKAFEWYGEFRDFGDILKRYLKPADNILQVGCGNSALAENLYDEGFRHVTSIDIVPEVINSQKVKQESSSIKRPELKYLVSDATNISLFADGSFTAAVDKGTLDALLSHSLQSTKTTVEKMFGEVLRLLQTGGRYLVLSLAQPEVLQAWADYFSTNCVCLLRVCQIDEVTKSDAFTVEKFKLPVFLLIVTVLKPLPNFNPIFEFAASNMPTARCHTVNDLCSIVASAQQYFQFCHKLHCGRQHTESSILIHTNAEKQEIPRYEITILDQENSSNGKYAIFIVPQGRDLEWIFSTAEGRKQLALQAGFGRLAVVVLLRGQAFKDLESVKAELSTIAMDFAPLYCSACAISDRKPPFLSIGQDIGDRILRHAGSSQISGEFIVEDTVVDGEVYRRLVFMGSQSIFQSEAKMVSPNATESSGVVKRNNNKHSKSRNSAKRVEPSPKTDQLLSVELKDIDFDYLACEHHRVMLLSFGLLFNEQSIIDLPLSICAIGLGGGSLPMFLSKHLPKATIHCVELDPTIVVIAKLYFGFLETKQVIASVADGVEFFKQKAQDKVSFDIILIDAACASAANEIICPPLSFLSQACLENLRSLLSSNNGILCLNLVTRNADRREDALRYIGEHFPVLFTCKVHEQVNEIIFATFPDKSNSAKSKNDYAKRAKACIRSTQDAFDSKSNCLDLGKLCRDVDCLSIG